MASVATEKHKKFIIVSRHELSYIRSILKNIQGKKAIPISKLNLLAITADERRDKRKLRQVSEYLQALPYKEKTSFGFVTLFDPREVLKNTVFKEECGIPCMGLDEAENVALDYLIKGRYYATTGITLHVKASAESAKCKLNKVTSCT